MGLRLVLALLAVWLIYSLLRHALGKRRARAAKNIAARPPVDMVCCARCGTHLPAPEALQRGADYYCCRAHLQADDEDS